MHPEKHTLKCLSTFFKARERVVPTTAASKSLSRAKKKGEKKPNTVKLTPCLCNCKPTMHLRGGPFENNIIQALCKRQGVKHTTREAWGVFCLPLSLTFTL